MRALCASGAAVIAVRLCYARMSADNAPMKKLLSFDTPREHYSCDAVVVSCFDWRFSAVRAELLRKIEISRPDQIIVAGGAKCLASPSDASERDFLLEQIRISVRLHGTKLAVLTLHSDCGAYGGLGGKFGGDARAEAQHHEAELRRATECLQQALPDLQVRAFLLDFSTVWETGNA